MSQRVKNVLSWFSMPGPYKCWLWKTTRIMSITIVAGFNSQEERKITTNIWYVVYWDTNHTDWIRHIKTCLHNPHTPRKNLSLLITTDQRKQVGRRIRESTRFQPEWPGFESRRRLAICDLSFLLVSALPLRGFLVVIRYVSQHLHWHSSSIRKGNCKISGCWCLTKLLNQ